MPIDVSTQAAPRGPAYGGVTLAALAASALLLLTGLAFHRLDARLQPPTANTAAPQALEREFASFPRTLDNWTGQDVPIEERLREATDTDALLNRVYRRPDGRAVGMYVAYGTRTRDLAPHRPEVCYPSAGWNINQVDPLEFDAEAQSVPTRLFHFSRGAFDAEQMIVCNYFVIDGRLHATVDAVRGRHWRVEHVAQVQIACELDAWQTPAEGERTVRDFLRTAAAPLHQMLSRVMEPQP